jgi:hypothetical protein
MDVEPVSDYSPDSVYVLSVPVNLRGSIVTNVAGLPVTISWVNGDMVSMRIPTNAPNRAIRYIGARDQRGTNIDQWTGSWDQFRFWKLVDRPPPGEHVLVSIAIVPNVHLTLYTQPRLLTPNPPEK